MTINLRIWGIASGAAAVAVLAGGWFLGVQPQLTAASTSTQSLVGVQGQNQATRLKLVGLTKAAAKLDEMKAQDAVLQKSVPTILKPNTFIRRVSEVAALDGVDVVSISPGDATAYTPAEAQSGGSSALALGKTSALISSADFTVVPVTLAVSGAPDSVLQFTHDIQNDERVFAINAVQTTKSDSSSDVNSSLTGYIYVLKR
jgi:Tfp pilus assembly protein PilO